MRKPQAPDRLSTPPKRSGILPLLILALYVSPKQRAASRSGNARHKTVVPHYRFDSGYPQVYKKLRIRYDQADITDVTDGDQMNRGSRHVSNRKYSLRPEPASANARVSPTSSYADRTGVQVPDEVQVSHLTDIILQGRSEHIAALRTIVTSPDYSASAVSVSRGIIAGALSRPD
jgi:hypothetical protein